MRSNSTNALEHEHETLDADDERILRLAAACHSNQEIADTLAMDVGDIANRKREAMQKIDVASRVQLLEYALARGWQDRP